MAMPVIVVTGASGYIGSALLQRLHAKGFTTRAVSRTYRSIDGADEVAVADLNSTGIWKKVLAGASGLIHLSSQTDLRAAELDPALDDRMNVAPVRALIEELKSSEFKSFPIVFTSTVTIFGDCPPLPCDEAAADNPLSTYDRHKLLCEALLSDAEKGGHVVATILRLANVYGWADGALGGISKNRNRGILNAMMARAVSGEALTIYGTGSYTRDFVHIDDVVSAILAALISHGAGDGKRYIIASGRGHSLIDAFSLVAREAESITHKPVEIFRVPEPADLHRSERRNFVGNPNLFSSWTGWRPSVDLEAGIRRSILQLTQTASPAIQN